MTTAAFPTQGIFFKKPDPIVIVPVVTEIKVKSLEGWEEATADQNRYIVSGAKDEPYLISQETFASYELISGTRHNYAKQRIEGYAEVTQAVADYTTSWGQVLTSTPGDYIIDNGKEKYPVKPDIFQQTYEFVRPA